MKPSTLARQVLFSTLRLETRNRASGVVGVGTSFVVDHPIPGHRSELFLVTNRHVLKDSSSVFLYLNRAKDGEPDIGNPMFVRLDDFDLTCHPHPDTNVDLVVSPLSWIPKLIAKDKNETPYVKGLPTDLIVRRDGLARFDAVTPILFVGYPNGIYDRTNYVPIFRRGTTATPPDLDYDGRPVFLIDASVFPGSSGSPVLWHIPTLKGDALAQVEILGVVSEVFYRTEEGALELRPAPTTVVPTPVVREMLDLGVVLKGYLILQAIESFVTSNKDRFGAVPTPQTPSDRG